MKYLIYPLSIMLILASCKSEPEEVTADRLVGEFIRVKDNGRVGDSQKEAPVITNITFRSKFCNFTYDGAPMSAKYTVDEGYVYIEVGGDLGTISMEIITANQLEGEGLINGSYMREGFEGEYEHIEGTGNWNGGSPTNGNGSSSDSNGNSGNGSENESDAGNNGPGEANMPQENTNASGNKESSGSSNETEKVKRIVEKHVSTAGVRAPGPTKVAFYVTVDPRGDVISVKLDKARTTTNNEVLVNSLTTKVKNELKYNKISGTDYMKLSYIVKL